MDQPKRLVRLEQRFGQSQKRVASGEQIRIKMLNDTALGGQVEVDQHIAAEDEVEPFLEQHLTVVTQVHAVKANLRLEQIVELEFVVADIFKGFPAQPGAGIAEGVRSVNSGTGCFERIIVHIGGENLPRPTGEYLVLSCKQKHGQSDCLHGRPAVAKALRMNTLRTSSGPMPASGYMRSARVAATTLPGIPQTTEDASSWTITAPPASRMTADPRVPSVPMPVSTTASTFAP